MYIHANRNYRIKGQLIFKSIHGLLDSPEKRKKLTILSIEDAQDNGFRSFFGRIEETINCFRDLLTFRILKYFSTINPSIICMYQNLKSVLFFVTI